MRKDELKVVENGLVTIYETSTGEKVVYGTELYGALGVKSRFNDWARNRLNDCEAIENEDYEVLTKNLVNGGRSKEYIIKLDTAKEMAMLERNEKGKQVRRYFIQLEKKFTAVQKAVTEQTMKLQKFMELQNELIQSILIRVESLEKKPALEQEASYKSGSIKYIDSREVAKMVGKEHKNLIRDIKRYSKELGELTFEPSDFFIGSTYENSQNKMMPCYLVTRKGCEFISHKLTGSKGTEFMGTYINRFHAMEDKLAGNENSILVEFTEKLIEHLEIHGKIISTVLERFDRLENQYEKKIFQLNPFVLADMASNDERLKELNDMISEIVELYALERNKTLHFLYKTVEEDLGISLNSYLTIYRLENNCRNLCMLHAIAANNRLYCKTKALCEDAIKRKRMFG